MVWAFLVHRCVLFALYSERAYAALHFSCDLLLVSSMVCQSRGLIFPANGDNCRVKVLYFPGLCSCYAARLSSLSAVA